MTDDPRMSGRLRNLPAWCLTALVLLGTAPLARPAAAAPPAPAPVFRHALEQWSAGDFEIIVFHRGPLAEETQSLLETCQRARLDTGANLVLRTVDVAAAMDKSMEDLWTGQSDPEPPWMVVRAPETSPDAVPVWSGALTPAALSGIIDSPARRKIIESLLRGATAVWVLLECGEAARDEAAVDTLTSNLRALEKKIQLPKKASGLRSALPLKVDFGFVRVTRSDPAEEFFVTLLEHGKPAFSSRPVAFPVFGRGRTLGALVGREIDTEGIGNVCAMLTAAIKEGQERLPGRDLLLSADWKRIFDPALASTPPKAPELPAAATPGTSSGSLSGPAVAVPEDGGVSWVMLLGGIALGAGILGFFLLRKPGAK